MKAVGTPKRATSHYFRGHRLLNPKSKKGDLKANITTAPVNLIKSFRGKRIGRGAAN
jgi:hypothetical protein